MESGNEAAFLVEMSVVFVAGHCYSLGEGWFFFYTLDSAGACGCCWWKSLMSCGAKRSRLATHWLSELGYPFHCTRYWRMLPLPCFLESRI